MKDNKFLFLNFKFEIEIKFFLLVNFKFLMLKLFLSQKRVIIKFAISPFFLTKLIKLNLIFSSKSISNSNFVCYFELYYSN